MKPFLESAAMPCGPQKKPQSIIVLIALVAGLATGLVGCAGRGGGGSPSKTPPSSSDKAASTAGAAPPPAATQGPASGRYQQALALMRDHKTDEAQSALEALAKEFPNLSGPPTNLGILYARSKQRDKAFDSFNRAIAANPKNATAYDWEGIIYRESGDYAHAEQSYLRAVAAQPDYPNAHLNLAILYDTYLRRPQDAVTQYREYQRLSGGSKPVVTAWIDELQPPAATSAAPAAPSK
jgi:tetratricopeptide (TPR) repeat protein